MMKKIISVTCLALNLLTVPAFAQSTSFVVKKIEFNGLVRITPRAAESYLPIKTGETLSPAESGNILRALYATGFFDRVSLSTEDHILIINVTERPTIGQLSVTGNSIIPKDKLMEVMKNLDITEGRVYNPAVIEKIKLSLLHEYEQMGYNTATVTIDQQAMSRNRIFLKITIEEGLAREVKRITFSGNEAFSSGTLTNQLDFTTSGIFTLLTHNDRYSDAKMATSLEKLRNYYLDHGYLQFRVVSYKAVPTEDHKKVEVFITVSEGKPYTVAGIEIQGASPSKHSEIVSKLNLHHGEVFSRQKVIEAEEAISKVYGNTGHIHANISLHPQVNDANHTVILVFNITSGKRYYVHHVTFSENNRTNDDALRREVQQFEGAPVSSLKLDDSKQRLNLLPFIRDVDMTIKPAPNKPDQVDVNYKVTENNSAQASFKLGYSQVYHAIVGVGLDQKNFFGTGNTFGFNVQESKQQKFVGIDYTNPYYTQEGISRSFNMSVSQVDPGAVANVSNGYTSNEYNLGVLYGIPVGDEHGVFNRISLGVSYQNTLLHIISGNASSQLLDFTNRHGRHFHEADFKIGYSRDSRDKAVFATRGMLQTLAFDVYAPLTSSSLTFVMASYHNKWYQPVYNSFIATGEMNLAYGTGKNGIRDFPFYKNYYAGGIGSVRGYRGYALGPLDSNGQAFGGNMLADASIGMIFPNYLTENLRTTAFFDIGNVYITSANRRFGGNSRDSGPLRYSVGIEADWLTPFGPIQLSLSKPLSLRKGEHISEPFQFALGANF